MKKNLALLIQLQAIDSKLMEIEEQKGDLPSRVEYLSKQLETLEQDITEKNTRLQEIERENLRLQAAIDDSREQLKKYQEQLLLVSTNRAYDALTAEIDSTKKVLDDGEFHLLELSEEREQLTDAAKNAELQLVERRSELAMQQESLQAMIKATDAETNSLQEEREQILSNIDPRYLSTYERIRAARDGLAVVSISRGACGVCFNQIPPQKQVEIKGMDKIVTCDSCGVILFWK